MQMCTRTAPIGINQRLEVATPEGDGATRVSWGAMICPFPAGTIWEILSQIKPGCLARRCSVRCRPWVGERRIVYHCVVGQGVQKRDQVRAVLFGKLETANYRVLIWIIVRPAASCIVIEHSFQS